MKIGSEAHKELFCRSFIESHLLYEPELLPWPKLEGEALERLRGIPFWGEALRTEQQAGVMVSAFAETITDPMIREAIALQGQEEKRHGRLLQFLINHYDIQVPEQPEPQVPDHIEQAFVDFGFGECLDSFFAFGMYELAHQVSYMPESLFTIFEPILDEEARHIVFFVNWVTYLQIQQGRGAGVLRATHSLWHYSRAILHLVQAFGNKDEGGEEAFTATGAKTFVDDLTATQFFSTTIQANTYRMRSFDKQLLQPMLLPRLSAIALRVLKLWPQRSQPVAKAEMSASKS